MIVRASAHIYLCGLVLGADIHSCNGEYADFGSVSWGILEGQLLYEKVSDIVEAFHIYSNVDNLEGAMYISI